jgi:ATP-dependent Zn protease
MGNLIDVESEYFPGTNKLKVTQYTGIYFKDIIGQDYVKKQLNECINYMNNADEFKKFNYKMPRGILFVGPPGTGKTMMAKALATEAAVNVIAVAAADFENAFYGSGPKNVRHLFKVAKKNTPCIIYIDEIDSIGMRNDIKFADKSSMINTLLIELDGFDNNTNILVIASTNNPNKIDPAILRSGRFDKEIVFDLPNPSERKQYFEMIDKKFLSQAFIDDYDNNINTLVRYTTGLSLADLSTIINNAKSLVLERLGNTNNNGTSVTTITTEQPIQIIDGEEIENEDKLLKQRSNSSNSNSEIIKSNILEVTQVTPTKKEVFTKKSMLQYWSKQLQLPASLFSEVYDFMKRNQIEDKNFILNVLYKYSIEDTRIQENVDVYTDFGSYDIVLLMQECYESIYNTSYDYLLSPSKKSNKQPKKRFFFKFENIKSDFDNLMPLGLFSSEASCKFRLKVKGSDNKTYHLANEIIMPALVKRYLETLNTTPYKRKAITAYINATNDNNLTLYNLQSICSRYADHVIKFPDNSEDGLTLNDLNTALDILVVGMAKKERTMSENEKRIVAYHEVGHALMGYLISGGKVPIKISIIPSGRNALGYTKHDAEDQYIISFEDYVAQIYCLLGGRCCESIIFNKIYSGASDDLSKVDKILNTMIYQHGMYNSIGFIRKRDDEQISENTLYRIERFKRKLVKMYTSRVKHYLSEFLPDIHKLADLLYNKEELIESDLSLENLSQNCISNKGKLVVDTKYANV